MSTKMKMPPLKKTAATAFIEGADIQSDLQGEKTAGNPISGLPWASANPKVKTVFSIRMPERVHMKVLWLSENLPNVSMHTLALEGIEKYVDALLAKHLPPSL